MTLSSYQARVQEEIEDVKKAANELQEGWGNTIFHMAGNFFNQLNAKNAKEEEVRRRRRRKISAGTNTTSRSGICGFGRWWFVQMGYD